MSGVSLCCAGGSLHTGTPAGRVERIHGFDCYISDPPGGTASKGSVVILPDIFGWKLPNSRILADEYAKQIGCVVYLPNFMTGDGLPSSAIVNIEGLFATGVVGNVMKIYHLLRVLWWIIPFKIQNPDDKIRARIELFFQALRTHEAANLPIGAAGFCWGGKWVVELCSDQVKAANGKSLIDVGYTAHPSNVKVPDDVEKIIKPLSVASSDQDPVLPKKQADQFKDILDGKTAKGKDQGITHEFVFYEGAQHGFAVRANEDDKAEAARGKEAEKQAVDWFTRWFSAA